MLELVTPVPDLPDETAGSPAVLADRYFSAEPIEWQGATVYPMYTEQLAASATSLTVTLLSATPPPGPASVGIGLSVVDGHIDIDGKQLTGVDIWRDALERGVDFRLTAETPDALLVLTPVWSDTTGTPRSWMGNYGIVVEHADSGRTVLWCSVGEGPAHFADLVVEIRSTPVDSAAPATRPADHTEVEGYPCSFADLFTLDRDAPRGNDFPRSVPHIPAVVISDLGYREPDFGAYDGWPAEWDGTYDETWYDDTVEPRRDSADPAGYHPAGPAGWADHPEQTGLVPVIRGAELPDYGPDPYRHAPAGGAFAMVPRPAAQQHYAEDDGVDIPEHDALADTVADGSLPPVPSGRPAPATDPADPDRLHTLGGAAHALGNDEQAALLWAPAARAGHIGAAYDLGLLYLRREEPEAAEVWWRAAAARRLIPAMAGLADLLDRRGAGAEARMWRAQAVAEEVIATATHPAIRTAGSD
ncbi:hypothetical protein [Nocardia sp. NPDC003345]